MNNKMIIYLLFGFILFTACEDDKNESEDVVDTGDTTDQVDSTDTTDDEPTAIETPTSYAFDSRFNEGESSVKYTGQVVRNLLLNDIKVLTSRLSSEGASALTVEDLTNLYNYDDALDLTSQTSTDPAPLEAKYSSISTGKNLIGKIDDEVVYGFDKTADELMTDWFAIVAEKSAEASNLESNLAFTSDDGLDLSQMINKTLLGAVPYSQGTSNYLGSLEDDGNAEASSEGGNYTEMEHHWDESFGYFGAAVDYNFYTDDEIKSPGYKDSNEDGSIDFISEYNHGISKNAAKRDIGAASGTVDFTKTIMDAYLEGRTLIHNQADISEILAQRDIIVNTWEKVIAATVIHYITDSAADMAALYPADSTAGPLSPLVADLNKHWGEMRGFTIALQYNDFALISDADLEEVSLAMGTSPVYPEDGYTEFYAYHGALLSTIRDTFQEAYGFSDEDVAGW